MRTKQRSRLQWPPGPSRGSRAEAPPAAEGRLGVVGGWNRLGKSLGPHRVLGSVERKVSRMMRGIVVSTASRSRWLAKMETSVAERCRKNTEV